MSGTLIVRKGCDLANCMHKLITKNEAEMKSVNVELESLKEDVKVLKHSCSKKVDSKLKLFDSLRLVSNHLREKLALQTQTAADMFKETCMSKFHWMIF